MSKKYIISSIVPSSPINFPFLESILYYCKNNDTELLLIPTLPEHKKDMINEEFVDLEANGLLKVVHKELQLNSKIRISNIPISPLAVDPVTGLNRQSQTDGSFIFASPKQRLKVVPNSNTKLPHVLMTPGAITLPDYSESRRGMIAKQDHVNGAIMLEIVDNVMYHHTQIEADSDGSFIHMFNKYNTDGSVESVNAEAIIPGDLHVGSTDPLVKAVIIEMINKGKPKHFLAHDLFDGNGISHHLLDRKITRAVVQQNLSITKELDITYSDIKEYADLMNKHNGKVHVVKSNHDDFIDRWLDSGRFMDEPVNLLEGLELATHYAKGRNPLEMGLRKRGKLSNVKFLKMDEDLKLSKHKIQCGAHGDKGLNGARGSAVSLEQAYSKCIIGHSHTPQLLRGVTVVGTSTHLKLSYNKGPSSWLQTMCILYPNGSRQLINVINGKYKG